MSYLKLPKTTMGHAVGYQTVNQAIDNNAALVTAFDAKHSLGVGGSSPYGFPTYAVGRHDDILIARTVVDFYVDTSPLVPLLTIRVGGPVLGSLLRYTRLATGQWRIFLATGQLFGCVALMKSTASVDRKATCYATYDPAIGPSVIVSTWNVATPTLSDFDFSMQIWTQAP